MYYLNVNEKAAPLNRYRMAQRRKAVFIEMVTKLEISLLDTNPVNLPDVTLNP